MPLATLRGRARGPQRPAAVAAPVAGSTSSTLHSLLHPTSTLGAHGRLCWLLSSCLMRAAHALQTRAACSASLRERYDRMCSIRSSLSVSISNSSYCRAPLGRALQFSSMKVLTLMSPQSGRCCRQLIYAFATYAVFNAAWSAVSRHQELYTPAPSACCCQCCCTSTAAAG